jgi:transposase
MEDSEVLVCLEADSAVRLCCPECGDPCAGYDAGSERRWRHLDTCGFSTIVQARVPRVRCPVHGVRTAKVPWSDPRSRYTFEFERYAIEVLRAAKSQARAARILRLTPGQVHDVMHRAVRRGMAKRAGANVRRLSLDEKAFRKNRRYVSILTDLDGRRVLDVCETREGSAVSAMVRRTLTAQQRERVECVTMDMWDAFVNAAQDALPKADIVFDRFHIAWHLGGAVDRTRIDEAKRLKKAGDRTLVGSKPLFLMRPEKMGPARRARYEELMKADLATSRAWALKEAFRRFFDLEDPGQGRPFFDRWKRSVQEAGNAPMKRVAKMLERYFYGVQNYLVHRTTNSAAEGANSLVQEIKFAARGFRTFEGFRTAILFFLGKLDLYPQKTP